ncbi:hypothetical protein CAPTEDRAFT_187171, partial [Capitella teleta]
MERGGAVHLPTYKIMTLTGLDLCPKSSRWTCRCPQHIQPRKGRGTEVDFILLTSYGTSKLQPDELPLITTFTRDMVVLTSFQPPEDGVRHKQDNTRALVCTRDMGNGSLFITE